MLSLKNSNSVVLLVIILLEISSSQVIGMTPTFSSLSAPNSSCADGWDHNPDTNSCYFIPKTSADEDMKSWKDASSYCHSLPIDVPGNGSWSGEVPRLVDIISEEEQKFLEQTIVGHQLDSNDFWTGGHDMVSEGEWKWSETNHTHFTANYTNWDEDQPAKFGGHWQDCLFLGHWNRFQLRWHDNPCTYNCFYICEYSLPSVVPIPSFEPSTSSSSSGASGVVVVVVVVLFITAGGILLFFFLLLVARRRQRQYRQPGRPGTSHSEIFGPMTTEAEPTPAVAEEESQGRTRATTKAIPNDLVAYFRKGFGWKRLDESDKRTLVENIVISIENDVGVRGGEGGGGSGLGGGGGGDGDEGRSREGESFQDRRNVST